MQKRSNKFMIGAIVGSTVGALTTLLFNTNEGKKVQKRLMKKFHEMHQKSDRFSIGKLAARYKKMVHKSRKSKSRKAR